MSENIIDGGYGNVGNTLMYIFLSTLPSQTKEDYEKNLKKEDSVAYEEYKEWEKIMLDNE